MTETTFLLNLTDTTIVLEKFGQDASGAQGWCRQGAVGFDVPDLGAALADMRAAADPGAPKTAVFVALPMDQVKTLSLPDANADNAAVLQSLDGATPYAVDQLSFDTKVVDGTTQVAAVALETLEEATEFLTAQDFKILGFVAVPGGAWDQDFADFGPFPTMLAKAPLPLASHAPIAAIAPPAVKSKPAAEKALPATQPPAKPASDAKSAVAKPAPAAAPKAAPKVETPPIVDAAPMAPVAATVAQPLPIGKTAATKPAATAPAAPPKAAPAATGTAPAGTATAPIPDLETLQAQNAKRDRRKKLVGLLLTAVLLLLLFAIAAWAGTAGRDRVAAWLGFGDRTPQPVASVDVATPALADGTLTSAEEYPSALVADNLTVTASPASVQFPSRLPRSSALPEGMPRIYGGSGQAVRLVAPNDPLAGRNLALEAALADVFNQNSNASTADGDLRRYTSTGVWTIPPIAPSPDQLARSLDGITPALEAGIRTFAAPPAQAPVLQAPTPSATPRVTPGVGDRFIAQTTLGLAGVAVGAANIAAPASQAPVVETPAPELPQTNSATAPALPDDQTQLAFASTTQLPAQTPAIGDNAAGGDTDQLASLDTSDFTLGLPDVVPPSRNLDGMTVIIDGQTITFAAPPIQPPSRPGALAGAQVTAAAVVTSTTPAPDAEADTALPDTTSPLADVTSAPEAPADPTQPITDLATADPAAQTPGLADETLDPVDPDLAPLLAVAPSLRPGTPEAPLAEEEASAAVDPNLVDPNLADPDALDPASADPTAPEPIATLRPLVRPDALPPQVQFDSNWTEEENLALAAVRPSTRPRGLPAPKPAAEPKPEPKPEPEPEPKPEPKPEPAAAPAPKPNVSTDIAGVATAKATRAAASVAGTTIPKPVSSPRPAARPRAVERAAARAAKAPAAKPQPKAEPAPERTGRVVVARRNEIAKPSGKTNNSVQKNATVSNVVNLRRIGLMGISGSRNAPKALVRMPNGSFVTVKVGDRLDGGRVAEIGNGRLRYVKNGRSITLKMPKT